MNMKIIYLLIVINTSITGSLYAGLGESKSSSSNRYDPEKPCYLAQLPTPIANQITLFYYTNSLKEKHKRSEEHYLHNNNLYRKNNPERSRFSSMPDTCIYKATKKWNNSYYNLGRSEWSSYVHQIIDYSLNEPYTILLKELGTNEKNPEIFSISFLLKKGEKEREIEIKNLTSSNSFEHFDNCAVFLQISPFTCSFDGKTVFYVEQSSGKNKLISRSTEKDGKILKQITLPSCETYLEMEFFEEFNMVGLLKQNLNIEFIPLSDDIYPFAEATLPYNPNKNMLDIWMQKRGVANTLASSLPSSYD